MEQATVGFSGAHGIKPCRMKEVVTKPLVSSMSILALYAPSEKGLSKRSKGKKMGLTENINYPSGIASLNLCIRRDNATLKPHLCTSSTPANVRVNKAIHLGFE
jgi:hypothetical protein